MAEEKFTQIARPQITFVSGNEGKIAETQAILGDAYQICLKKIDLPEYQGEPDFICAEKAKCAATQVNTPVVVEDTSLEFNALNGLPGPYVKWFYEKLGTEGLFKMLDAYSDKSAVASCVLAFCEGPDADVKLFHGATPGVITLPRGENGFSWDPLFLPDGSEKTYGELSFDEKNAISHRTKAILLFKDYLLERYPQQS